MNPNPENSLPQEVKMYLAALDLKGRQPTTVRRYMYDLEDFFMWLRIDDQPAFSEISSEEIQEYLTFLENQKHYSKRTVKRVFSVLNRFYAYLSSLGTVTQNPVSALSIHKQEDPSPFTKEDFISEQEIERLFQSTESNEGLSENQQRARVYLSIRNLAIFTLFLYHGLTLRELTSLIMRNIHFETRILQVPSISSHSRTINISNDETKKLYSYYGSIPKAVRPRQHSDEPLFVAFDFQRNTYRWDYASDAPKALTEIAVQKMIRKEVARAGLRKGISAQHMRRTFILRMIQNGETLENVQSKSGFKSKLALKKYRQYAES